MIFEEFKGFEPHDFEGFEKDEFMRTRILPHLNATNEEEEFYELACEYMAKTELYDRSTIFQQGKYPDGAVIVHPRLRPICDTYAKNLMHDLTLGIPEYKEGIKKIMHKYNYYTADKWIEEWYRVSAKKPSEEAKELINRLANQTIEMNFSIEDLL